MKKIERDLSRSLRKKGLSINEICLKTGFAKGSVSAWVRDINLSEDQKKRLSNKGLSIDVIERRRLTRLNKEKIRRDLTISLAIKDIGKLSLNDLFIIGVALYWAEGGKTGKGLVRFSNSDPLLIKIMMRFFQESCFIPIDKIRGYIHIHRHLDHIAAEKYWSEISEIPLMHFYKTYRKENVSSKNKMDSLPYGTFDIYICSTDLFLKIKGWMTGMYLSLQ